MSEIQRMPLWTAASSEGQYCALDRTFAWCTTGTIVEMLFINDIKLWDATPKGSASDGNCVTMSLTTNESSAQLSLAACSDSKSYMCQVLKLTRFPQISCINITFKQPKCETGSCPNNCTKNVTNLFLRGFVKLFEFPKITEKIRESSDKK
jgi:hypothetical protein